MTTRKDDDEKTSTTRPATAPKPTHDEATDIIRRLSQSVASASITSPAIQADLLDAQRYIHVVDAHAETDTARKGKLFARAETLAAEHRDARARYEALANPTGPAPETSSAPKPAETADGTRDSAARKR